MKIRVLIVDDEPLARTRIRALLKEDARIEIAGEAGNGPEAVAAIRDLSPDLVFLDIQMPEMNGFDVIRAVGPDHMPGLIFTTAHDQYALQAFEVHAQDYLLKPIVRERFRRTMDRAVEQIRKVRVGDPGQSGLSDLLRELRAWPGGSDRLLVKSGEKWRLVKAEEIDWIEAADKYVVLHCGAATHTLRESLNDLDQRLDPRLFLRVHRSHIVNLDAIRELQPWFQGQIILILKNGDKITVSRTFREQLERLFKK